MLLNRLSEQEKEAWEQIGQIIQDEHRTNNSTLKMSEALSDEEFLCQSGIEKLQLTNSEAICVREEVAKADCECQIYISTVEDVLEQLA